MTKYEERKIFYFQHIVHHNWPNPTSMLLKKHNMLYYDMDNDFKLTQLAPETV